jgi:hypothetical protein
MLTGTPNRTQLPVTKLPSQLGSHPRQPPLPNVQGGLASNEVRVDRGLGSSRPLGNHAPSHRHLPSIPNKRGQLFPGGHERRQLRHSPRRLGKRLPSSNKLRRDGVEPCGAGGNDLIRTPLKRQKLVNPLLVGPLLPSLVNKPTKRPSNLPQDPSPPPNPVRPGATSPSSPTETDIDRARADRARLDCARSDRALTDGSRSDGALIGQARPCRTRVG